MFLQYGHEHEPLEEHGWAFSRVVLAERFGWSLEYIDSLDHETVGEIFGVISGQNKQRAYQAEIERERSKGRRKR